MQRGIGEEDAVALIVNGFCKEVLQSLPMEFAMEAQKLVAISLEGLLVNMLKIDNLKVSLEEEEKQIIMAYLSQLTLVSSRYNGAKWVRKVHTFSVLAGKDGYTVDSGSVTFEGSNLLEVEVEKRAALGFLWPFSIQ